MAISGSAIFLSTILLEKNRSNGKGPSLLVSDWIEPIGEAGFAGVDLWLNHLRLSSRSEWQLIKDLSGDSDLKLTSISAVIPADSSDKSQKLREAVVEACAYFLPDRLKFSVAEDGRSRGLSASLLDSLEFIKNWSRDLPRETGMLFDGGPNQIGADSLAQLRKLLDGKRYQAALHPFLMSQTEFASALKAAGDFLGNLGVQAKEAEEWILLEDKTDEYTKIISTARKGFQGTWTLECTKGVGRPTENIDNLFDNAEKDLNFLNEIILKSGR